jgi:hypothetical protein
MPNIPVKIMIKVLFQSMFNMVDELAFTFMRFFQIVFWCLLPYPVYLLLGYKTIRPKRMKMLVNNYL